MASLRTGGGLATLAALLQAILLIGCSGEGRAWTEASATADAVAYRAYLERYPKGEHAAEANSALDEAVWVAATSETDLEAVRAYAKEFPQGKHQAEVLGALYRAAALGSSPGGDEAQITQITTDGRCLPGTSPAERESVMRAFESGVCKLLSEETFCIAVPPYDIRPGPPGQITLSQDGDGVLMTSELPSEQLSFGFGGGIGRIRIETDAYHAYGAVLRFKGAFQPVAGTPASGVYRHEEFAPVGWRIVGEDEDPLCFVLLAERGLTYFMGRGVVTSPVGTTYELPGAVYPERE